MQIFAFRRSQTLLIPWYCDFAHYKERHLVECYFMRIKDYRRIAMRFDKLASRFLAFLHLAAALLWLA